MQPDTDSPTTPQIQTASDSVDAQQPAARLLMPTERSWDGTR
ncbi:hypothetical protein [Acidovorax sp. Leaf76]|nr:hypothetical protein [Acidovorax sp. Leaf76]